MVSPTGSPRHKAGQSPGSLPARRILYLLLACGIQAIYTPTSYRTFGGIEPRLPFESHPIWPVWVVPYVLCYLLWFYGLLWIVFKTNDRAFRSFLLAFFITCSISITTFLVFPTYVRQADLAGSDFFTSLLRYIHENYGRYNAFPSGHVYLSALLALFFSRWHPRHKPLWVLAMIIVSLSTLFTGQHYIVDILGGLLVACAGYRLGIGWTGFPVAPASPVRGRLLNPPGS